MKRRKTIDDASIANATEELGNGQVPTEEKPDKRTDTGLVDKDIQSTSRQDDDALSGARGPEEVVLDGDKGGARDGVVYG